MSDSNDSIVKLQKKLLEVFCKKGILKDFATFTEKHLCRSLLFNKVVDFRTATLFKK